MSLQSETIETKCGPIRVFFQGSRTSKIVILTAHDLGCNHNEMISFVSKGCMEQLRNHCSWVHVLIPGQGDGDPDLPADYTFPKMQQFGEAMGEICDALGIKHVVVFGEGAGANILARLAMIRENLVLGAVLIHCTGTSAGIAETLRDRLIGWKLNSMGMNPGAESYLLLHRFGTSKDVTDEIELKHVVENFRNSLRDSINPKNLNKFIMAFMNRTKIIDRKERILCPILFLTGALASHNHTVHRLYGVLRQAALNDPERLKSIELVELDDVANVLQSRPDRVADCLLYFLQGIGLASTVVSRRMSNTIPPSPIRGRSLSMEEYDQPKGVSSCIYDKGRKYSTAFAEGDDEVA